MRCRPTQKFFCVSSASGWPRVTPFVLYVNRKPVKPASGFTVQPAFPVNLNQQAVSASSTQPHCGSKPWMTAGGTAGPGQRRGACGLHVINIYCKYCTLRKQPGSTAVLVSGQPAQDYQSNNCFRLCKSNFRQPASRVNGLHCFRMPYKC